MKAGELTNHPLNPKVHLSSQKSPLRGLLHQVGKVDILKAYYSERNSGALTLWDGHCRSELDADQEWNVGIYDLTDAEADLLLVTFDAIGWEARQTRGRVENLLRDALAQNEALQEFLKRQSEKYQVLPVYETMDEPDDDNPIHEFELPPEPSIPSHTQNTAKPAQQVYPLSIVLDMKSLNDWRKYKESVGQKTDTESFKLLLQSVNQ